MFVTERNSNLDGINKGNHPHQLRHIYATHLLCNGAPLGVIQSLLGFEKSKSTRTLAQVRGNIRQKLHRKYFQKGMAMPL
ncbi:tyrosine-type recombinase/integrase [Neobacillus endophyticus]|uniref:tyrosine-type recombinase/integrase n=1 Tax=Neobacillus endophyticus TaxID=2738405 RepID=UPI0028AEB9B4|nr:tyrosine-type recombinase/integrase [Neobacillus endophyticus]